MKLCFSTLGCCDWTLREACAAAKDLAFSGIEIRRLENAKHAPDFKCFTGKQLAESIALLREKELCIPLLASRAVFGTAQGCADSMQTFSEYCALAKKLGVPYVKVALTDRPTALDYNERDALAGLTALCAAAAHCGVAVLITSNGAFSNSALLAEFLEKAAVKNCAVLWDIHYTVRIGAETPAQTVENLGDAIRFVQIKDSSVRDARVEYRLPGSGDLPVKQAVKLLKARGYDGYYSCEWKKSWGDEFISPGIVLSKFCAHMARLEKETM
ncbi:MAG: sugar phosphate isomerase/epimerase [Oscillospiraceae bacterium]|nr:sugar phosphate isomerase/epimerase [Oscillospiraceae bacterium]